MNILRTELSPLFDAGLTAFHRRSWEEARRYLAEVVRFQPGYTREGIQAAALLAEAERQLNQPVAVSIPRRRRSRRLIASFALLLALGLCSLSTGVYVVVSGEIAAQATVTARAEATHSAVVRSMQTQVGLNMQATASIRTATARRHVTSTAQQATVNAQATAAVQTATTYSLWTTAIAVRQSTLTAQAQATTDAQATSTAASLAATATVQTQIAATAQALASVIAPPSVQATIEALARLATRVYGPADNQLEHHKNDAVEASVSVRLPSNFIVEGRFYNPDVPLTAQWSYGFMFRDMADTAKGHYRVYIQSDGKWRFASVTPRPGKWDFEFPASGNLSNLDRSPNGSNQLRLVVNGGEAYLFVNGKYIDTLNVSERLGPGLLWPAIEFEAELGVDGKVTRYEDLTAWELP